MSNLEKVIQPVRNVIQNKQWQITKEKPINSGHQLTVSNGEQQAFVNIYSTGKILIQNAEGPFRSALQKAFPLATVQGSPNKSGAPSPLVTLKATGHNRIGMDEVGKGDYYGPLVAVAAYVAADIEEKVIALGVRDSKELDDHTILRLAKSLKPLCPHNLTILLPSQYNEQFKRQGNSAPMLGKAHAEALEGLLLNTATAAGTYAIADAFPKAEDHIGDALGIEGKKLKISYRQGAEDDAAVAVAAILARAVFLHEMETLSIEVGKELPKGASDPKIITIGKAIFAQGGLAALGKVAKLHFSITDKITTQNSENH
jgi:ribonuclease HIII